MSSDKIKRFPLVDYYCSLSIPAKAGMWFLACNFLQKGIASITTPIYTRVMSSAEYGQISSYFAWLDLLSILITFGIHSSIYQRGIIRYNSDRDNFSSSMLGLAALTSLVSFAIYFFCRNILNQLLQLDTFFVVMIYLNAFFLSVFGFWSQQKRVEYQYAQLVVLTLAISLLKPAFSILFIVISGKDPIVIRVLVETIITVLVGIYMAWSILKKSHCLYKKKYWNEAWVYLFPLIPHYLSQRVLSQADRVMIKNMVGAREAGIYSLSYSVGMLLNILTSALDSTISPWMYKKIRERKFQEIADIGKSLMILFALCVMGFSLFAPELVKLFAPAEYTEAADLIPMISLSCFFMFVYTQFIYFEYYIGKTQYITIATVLSAVLNILMNVIFINIYGYRAAAVTTVVCYIFYAIGHYFVMKNLCKIEFGTQEIYDWKWILAVGVALIAFSFAVQKIYAYCIIRYFMIALIAALSLYYLLRFLRKFRR